MLKRTWLITAVSVALLLLVTVIALASTGSSGFKTKGVFASGTLAEKHYAAFLHTMGENRVCAGVMTTSDDDGCDLVVPSKTKFEERTIDNGAACGRTFVVGMTTDPSVHHVIVMFGHGRPHRARLYFADQTRFKGRAFLLAVSGDRDVDNVIAVAADGRRIYRRSETYDDVVVTCN